MLTSSSHQHEGFVNFIPAGGLRQFHTGMRASPMCVQRLADSVRSRLMCCHGMWKHVDAGSCIVRVVGPSRIRWLMSDSLGGSRREGAATPCGKPRHVAVPVRASGRGRVCDLSVCVCVCLELAQGGGVTGANQALSRLCERGRFPQDVLRPRPCRPGPRRR
jgi:hypothetical protein